MITLLEYALALEKERNFARAARQLGISQPTLTRGIQELERQFSAHLFDRTRRGVFPTGAGKILLERARRVTVSLKDLRNAIDLYQGLQQAELRLGVGPVVAQTWIPDAIALLLQTNPQIEITVKTNDFWELVPHLLNQSIDLAIGEVIPDINKHSEISVIQLPPRPIRFFCRVDHPLTKMKSPSIADIGQYPMASSALPLRASEHFGGTRALGKLSENGLHFEPQISCHSFDVCCRIIRASDNIGIAPLSQLSRLPADGGVVIVPFEAGSLRTNYAIMHLCDRTLSPSAAIFVERALAAEKSYHSLTPGPDEEKSKPRKR